MVESNHQNLPREVHNLCEILHTSNWNCEIFINLAILVHKIRSSVYSYTLSWAFVKILTYCDLLGFSSHQFPVKYYGMIMHAPIIHTWLQCVSLYSCLVSTQEMCTCTREKCVCDWDYVKVRGRVHQTYQSNAINRDHKIKVGLQPCTLRRRVIKHLEKMRHRVTITRSAPYPSRTR